MDYNLHGGFVPELGRRYWVILSPEEPVVGRLVERDGRFYLVIGDKVVPVSLEAPPRAEAHRDLGELPEPDYEAFRKWCVKSVSERTCREYVRYLRRFPWPLRREDLYSMELTKWHVLALRNYIRFLSELGYGVGDWLRLKALSIPQAGEDRYVPPVEAVRASLPRLAPRYRLVYYVILYSALRLEHALRLLEDWSRVSSRVEPLPGSCVRLVPPPGWPGGRVKRVFYVYMPGWLVDTIAGFLSEGYRVPRRDSVTKHAREKGAPAPKYIRKFALDRIAEMLGPDIAAHIAGHDPGAQLQRALGSARTKVTGRHYVRLEDIAAERYYEYARWLERNVAPRSLLSSGI